ncbi:hypothetical protein KUCAC02_000731, partial [Chaenocephalus aceratus]
EIKDPLRVPKGDPFREEGEWCTGRFVDPFHPGLKPAGTKGAHTSSVTDRPWGSDTCTALPFDNRRQRRPRVGFLMTHLYKSPTAPSRGEADFIFGSPEHHCPQHEDLL